MFLAQPFVLKGWRLPAETEPVVFNGKFAMALNPVGYGFKTGRVGNICPCPGRRRQTDGFELWSSRLDNADYCKIPVLICKTVNHKQLLFSFVQYDVGVDFIRLAVPVFRIVGSKAFVLSPARAAAQAPLYRCLSTGCLRKANALLKKSDESS